MSIREATRMVFKQETLQVRGMMGRTPAFALALILFTSVLVEGIARIPAVRALLPTPSVGSQNIGWEPFVAQADMTTNQYGKIDCIVVGSSLVRRGIDLPELEETYQSKTGDSIHCVKLASGSLSASSVGILASFLVKVYHPRLIIYGGNVRDYSGSADPTADPLVAEIVNTPWYRYRSGQYSLQGWLVDHSNAFRYLLTMRNWMKLPTKPSTWHGINVDLPLQRDQESDFIRAYGHLTANPPALRGVDTLASLNTPDTQIVMAQIPTHPSFVLYLEHGQQDFDRILGSIEHEAQAHGLLYWRAENLPLASHDLWLDRAHLSISGAIIYSRWLGERLAIAVQRGEIRDPTHATVTDN